MRVPINDRAIDKLQFPVWVYFQAVDVNDARALYVYAATGELCKLRRLIVQTGDSRDVNGI